MINYIIPGTDASEYLCGDLLDLESGKYILKLQDVIAFSYNILQFFLIRQKRKICTPLVLFVF